MWFSNHQKTDNELHKKSDRKRLQFLLKLTLKKIMEFEGVGSVAEWPRALVM